MKISILGTGAFGMALANVFHDNKCSIKMWTNNEDEMNMLLSKRKSDKIDYDIPSDIVISTDMEEVVNDTDIIIMAVPAKYVGDTSKVLNKYYKKSQVICIASKGIEQNSCLFLYDVIRNNINTPNIGVISGGTFAVDIIKKVPVGFSLASRSNYSNEIITKAMENDYVKLRHTRDIIGTEICGSIKNVIALASGILGGLNASDSTRAMFITESIHDIEEIIDAFDGDRRTVLSFAGFGDLLLTCTSTTSRNYSYGKLVGERKSKEELDNYVKNTTVEGYYTLESIYQLLNDKNVSIPIIDLIYNIIKNDKNPKELLTFLVTKV